MAASASERLISIDGGTELYVRCSGDETGSPIVLIPGWCYTGRVFDALLARLPASYRTVTIDPRSHGRSPVADAGNDYVQHGRDLAAVLESLDLRGVTLVGWSLGAYDALSYIEQFGAARVKALVVADESPYIVAREPDDWAEGGADDVEGLIAAVEQDFHGFFADYMRSGFVVAPADELVAQFVAAIGPMSADIAAGLLRAACAHDFTALLRQLDAELALHYVLREDWADNARRWIQANTPRAAVDVFGNHLMLYEYPDRFAESVRRLADS
ncbi:MAG: alpha/beta hydrolase [Pseudomonadota bacterium]